MTNQTILVNNVEIVIATFDNEKYDPILLFFTVQISPPTLKTRIF